MCAAWKAAADAKLEHPLNDFLMTQRFRVGLQIIAKMEGMRCPKIVRLYHPDKVTVAKSYHSHSIMTAKASLELNTVATFNCHPTFVATCKYPNTSTSPAAAAQGGE